MRLLSLVLAVLQVSAVLGFTYRSFQLTETTNGACILADTADYKTLFRFNNLLSKDGLPLIFFNYFDYVKFKDFPNLNEFLNDSYIDGRINKLLRVQPDGSFHFKLRPGNGYTKLPERYINYTLAQDEVFDLPIVNKGIYCTYIPKYPKSSKFLVDVEIIDELLPIDSPRHLDVHVKVGCGLVALIGGFFLVHSILTKSHTTHSHKVASSVQFTPITKLVLALLQLRLLGIFIVAVCEKLILTFPNNPYAKLAHGFLNQHVYPLEHSSFDPLFDAFAFVLATGYLYTNKLPKKFYLVLGIYLSSYFTKSLLLQQQLVIPGEFQLLNVGINNQPYDILYNSIITGAGLNADVKKHLNVPVYTSSVVLLMYHVFAANIFFPASIVFGFTTLRNLKKQSNPDSSKPASSKSSSSKSASDIDTRPLSYMVYGFLILYSLVVKKMIMRNLLPNFLFDGLNDFGEILIVVHRFIGSKLIGNYFIKTIDIVIVYLIWSFIHKPQVKKQKTS